MTPTRTSSTSPSATGATRTRARKGEGERLREEILDATRDLLIETGSAEEASIRAVAERVGVTPPSIYRHFEDKDTLLFEVCQREFDSLARAIEAVADAEADDPVEFFRKGTHAYVRFAVDHPEHYRIMLLGKEQFRPEQYLHDGENAFSLLIRGVRGLVDTGRVRGPFLEMDELQLALLFWSAMHGLAALLATRPALPWPDLDELIDRQVDLVLEGLLAPEATGQSGSAARKRSGKSRRRR